jgi:hypothetical protein
MVRGFTTGDMVRESQAVVRGVVANRQGVWNTAHTRIYTDSQVRVIEVLAGDVSTPEITVRQIGGTVGDVSMTVAGVAPIQTGEEVLLFLRTDGERYYLVGMAQGKFAVRVGPEGAVVARSLEGLALMSTGPQRAATPRSYEQFRASIRFYATVWGR